MGVSPLIDPRHQDFVLHELLAVERMAQWPAHAGHGRETFDAALDLAHRLSVRYFHAANRTLDSNEPVLVDGRVRLPAETAAALAAYREAGFFAATADAEAGGMQLPYTVALACDALFAGGSVALAGYPMLSKGAANLIGRFGSDEQRRCWQMPLLEGRYFGTMCLSEPQAGSSLADISTSAEAIGEGRYRLRGAKMWISGGEHELAANIVHMVLARTPGAPPGVRGISLFIVPRYRLDADGAPCIDNHVRLAGLNHKLGQRGIVNAFLKFGEEGDCIGELIGAEGQGLAAMFSMMNEARLGVGVGAVMLGLAGYRHSLAYARERCQGRDPMVKDARLPQVPIIEHADVRRMLLQQRAWTEGAYLLAMYAATLVDVQAHAPDPDARMRAARLLAFLTPVVKACSADWCVAANDLAIQVLGGYGYTREYPVEQYWRDNRLNPIHEGSNGIQALDLLARKLPAEGGAGLRALLERIGECLAEAGRHPELVPFAQALAVYCKQIADVSLVLGRRMAGDAARSALAHAHLYMRAVGQLCLGWLWLWQASAASAALATADPAHSANAFYRGKLATCRFVFEHELPGLATTLGMLHGAADCIEAASADTF